MFVVIFRAKERSFDKEYSATVDRLRQLALGEYGCVEFYAMTEGRDEVAISYWPDEESIRRWKAQAEHVLAQESGRHTWYESYSVDVAKVVRSYQSGGTDSE